MSSHCGSPDCLLVGAHRHMTGVDARVICSCCQGDVSCRQHADRDERIAVLESELAQARQQLKLAMEARAKTDPCLRGEIDCRHCGMPALEGHIVAHHPTCIYLDAIKESK